MKLTIEQLNKMIREAITESDDFDMGSHVHHKRMGRQRRGEPDPRNLSAGDSTGTYVDSPGNTRAVVADLIKQAGGDEALADSILAAVLKMKEDGLI